MKLISLLLFCFISCSSFAQSLPPDSVIRKNLIGQWKDENSTTVFAEFGKYTIYFEASGYTKNGKWSVKKGILKFYDKSLPQWDEEYKILQFEPGIMRTQFTSYKDTMTWVSIKIDSPVVTHFGIMNNEVKFDKKNISIEEIAELVKAFKQVGLYDTVVAKRFYIRKIGTIYEILMICNNEVMNDKDVMEDFAVLRKKMQVFFANKKIHFVILAGDEAAIRIN